jgi:hypothetical protein
MLNGLQTNSVTFAGCQCAFFKWQYTETRDKASETLVTVTLRHTLGYNSNVRPKPKINYKK